MALQKWREMQRNAEGVEKSIRDGWTDAKSI
jgi:hypothetical protein